MYTNILAEIDMNSVLNNGLTLQEKLTDGGLMILRGMATVFAVLFIIWAMISIFGLVVSKATSRKSSKKKDPETPVEKAADVKTESQRSNDEEIIAAITAAIEAYISENEPDSELSSGFRVVSYRRKSSGSPWHR